MTTRPEEERSYEEILRAVRAACARYDVHARVSVALPGRLYENLFGQIFWPSKG